MDNVDIGGASAHGRPEMPAMTTIDVAGGDLGGTVYPADVLTSKKAAAAPVVSSLFGPAAAAYAEDHPANSGDFQQVDGALVLTRSVEARRTDLYKPLGDIREGYVTGPRAGGKAPAESTEVMLETLRREVEAAERHAGADREPAHDDTGDPLIEVLYHLDIGVLASYYSQVVEQDRWLVFVDDTKRPAAQKFIPKPLPAGSEPLEITITGSDRVESRRRIVPLGINFSLGRYDIFVTMLAPNEEAEGHGEA